MAIRRTILHIAVEVLDEGVLLREDTLFQNIGDMLMSATASLRGKKRNDGSTQRTVTIGLIGFLTLVDLFAAQALLPMLSNTYNFSPGTMGLAVNVSTIGMAIAGLLAGVFSDRVDRRTGIQVSLLLLSIPTVLLAFAPNLLVFGSLRIVQGLFMATAFALTMTYLSEKCSAQAAAGALAAYVTGVVASNLVGRLIAGSVAEYLGLSASFFVFAALNLTGAALASLSLSGASPMAKMPGEMRSAFTSWKIHFQNPPLCAAFGVGFLILFAFIGTYTYVNFVLSGTMFGLTSMSLGFVYLVFLPSMFTTPLAARAVEKFGTRRTFMASLLVAGIGLPMLISSHLLLVLAGLSLIGIGTFFAQATATGFVGRAARTDLVAASGLYLAAYYFGGLVGSALLGIVFDRLGWTACVLGIALALGLAAYLARYLCIMTAMKAPDSLPTEMAPSATQ